MKIDPVDSPIAVDREELLSEIRAARDRTRGEDGKPEGSVFVGINNKGLHSDGTRIIGEPLLRTFTNDEWVCELKIYAAADLRVKGIEPFKGEVTQIVTINELDDEPLQIRYYGLELKEDGCWGVGGAVLDPRAHIVPEMLTDTTIVWPFVYVYAEIQSLANATVEYGTATAKSAPVAAVDEAVRVLAAGLRRDWSAVETSPMEEQQFAPDTRDGTPVSLRAPPSPEQRRRKLPIVDVAAPTYDDPQWGAPCTAGLSKHCVFPIQADHWDTGTPDPTSTNLDDRTAEALQMDARSAAEQGQHKEAYQLMEKAISLVCASSDRPVLTAHEADYASAREENSIPPSGAEAYAQPKSFKPAVTYSMPDGSVYVIAAGLYTEDEFFTRTIEAQDMVAAANKEAAGKTTLSQETMSKYSDPLTRTDSQCDSMQAAESELIKLGDSLAAASIKTPVIVQQEKWDDAAVKLKEQAAALWWKQPS